MSPTDDTSRERDDRPNRPDDLPPAADAAQPPSDHAIPFGKGVYGLGRSREEPSENRTSLDEPHAARSATFGHDLPPTHETPLSSADEIPFTKPEPEYETHGPEAPPPPPPEFDFGRLAAEFGFEGHRAGSHECVGWCPICRTSDLLRSFATPELQSAWSDFQRELARAMLAVAQRYAAREPGEPGERITEIPID